MYARYRITGTPGFCQFFPTLLSALQHRKHLLAMGCHPDSLIIEEWIGEGGWKWFDADQFLAGLEKMLAPAE